MKYFVISDVHGFYDEMIAALDKAGFDPSNPEHTLVSCGDAWDRGPKPIEVAEYLTSLPRAVLVRGNHEDLIEDAVARKFFGWHDASNGTILTCEEFSGLVSDVDSDVALLVKTAEHPLYQKYLSMLVDYFETEHYIFVHSWIPTNVASPHYSDSWRQAHAGDWERARWQNPFRMDNYGRNKTGKKIVFGHYHTSWPRYTLDHTHEEFPPTDDPAMYEAFAPYETKTAIGIDACTAYTGFCNCLVLED